MIKKIDIFFSSLIVLLFGLFIYFLIMYMISTFLMYSILLVSSFGIIVFSYIIWQSIETSYYKKKSNGG